MVNISSSEWEAHFTSLNEEIPDSTPFHHHVSNTIGNFNNFTSGMDAMNHPIQAQEFHSAVKKLKSKKSPGPDLIINEMIKLSSSILVDHY